MNWPPLSTRRANRFSSWLIVVGLVALLLAVRTLAMLRLARVPGIPAGREIPGPVGTILIIVLALFALVADFLDAVARHPRAAAMGATAVSATLVLVRDLE